MDQHHPSHEPSPSASNDPIAKLLKVAGSRPHPDPERTANFKSDLRVEWRRVTAHRVQRRTFGWAAAVAAAAAAIVLVWLSPWRLTEAPTRLLVVARAARIEGIVQSTPTTAASVPSRTVTEGDEVPVHTRIDTTGGGRAALMLADGVSLRIDVASRVVMAGAKVVRVERGAVYVDSGRATGKPVLVQTSNGDVRDIGTQFEVRQESSSLRVLVREGEVLVQGAGPPMTARAGEALHVDASGQYSRSTVSIFGPEWAWTRAIAPQFELEGSTVQQFLEWVAREQGWRWRFADAETARKAAGIVTHGSLEGYTPEEALAMVLPTCGLSFERNGDELIVSFAKGSSPRDR